MPSPQKILDWAYQIMPQEKVDWLRAMKMELSHFSGLAEQRQFAMGCLKVALFEWAGSRKGLNYIARGGGAFLLSLLSIFGILAASNFGVEPESIATSKLITSLCLFYMCGAVLLIVSLKGLKIYAVIGLCAALTGWLFSDLVGNNIAHLPIEIVTAINIEAAGLMMGLFLVATYLGWLYTPDVHDA